MSSKKGFEPDAAEGTAEDSTAGSIERGLERMHFLRRLRRDLLTISTACRASSAAASYVDACETVGRSAASSDFGNHPRPVGSITVRSDASRDTGCFGVRFRRQYRNRSSRG